MRGSTAAKSDGWITSRLALRELGRPAPVVSLKLLHGRVELRLTLGMRNPQPLAKGAQPSGDFVEVLGLVIWSSVLGSSGLTSERLRVFVRFSAIVSNRHFVAAGASCTPVNCSQVARNASWTGTSDAAA